MENLVNDLKTQWAQLKNESPKLRIRDAAKQLNVSEADLVNLNPHNIRLNNDFKSQLQEVESLGYVMALTRNDHCVHERKGVYTNVSFNAHVGLAVNADIDLRLFMGPWTYGFAVNENDRLSLQYFSKSGLALHKIYLTEKSDIEAYHNFVKKYALAHTEDLEILAQSPKEKASEHIPDVEAFQKAWLDLKDTHDFFSLLRKHKLSRTRALSYAPEGYAQQISLEQFKNMLREVSSRDIEIMAFVGNEGCIQIHSGAAKKQVETGPWWNVLDPEFNLHLRLDAITELWMVKKPTSDGPVNSLELFDAEGELVVQFFGKRKPGIPELQSWTTLLAAYQA